jgi:hypothetical protein
MIAGLFGTMNYSFGLIFDILGIVTSVGCLAALRDLKNVTQSWHLGLPLAGVLVTGTICALYAVIMLGPAFPAEVPGLFVMNTGIVALLLLAPCACFLFAALLQSDTERTFIRSAIVISAVVSLLSLAMILDMVFMALQLFQYLHTRTGRGS